jgi:protein MpaA
MHGTYRELAARWKGLRSHDLHVREVACVNAPRTLLCAELGDAELPAVALAAGLHGDEPAGVWALFDLVRTRALDRRFSYRIWPCLNPSGFDAGSRESAGGVDLNRTFGRGGESPETKAVLTANRDRRFVLSLDLHEDRDACGFYCYEYGGGSIGRSAIAAVEAAGYRIDPLEETFDLAGPLPDAYCTRERGRITADPYAEAALLGGLSYSLAIARRAARHALTFETPGKAAFETRVAMHRIAVQAAIGAVSETTRHA